MDSILEKLRQIKDNPGYFKGLTPEEQAELFLLLLTPKKKIFQKPKIIEGRKGKDGITPKKDKDYLSKEASLAILNGIRAEVQKTLADIKPIKGDKGKDAEITPGLIEQIVLEAASLVPVPRFPIETTQMVINAQDEITFIKDELARLEEELKNRQQPVFYSGISKNTVLKMIQDNQTGGSVSFETVSKNLDATDTSLGYTGDNLTSITYSNGIIKTFTYTGDKLTSIVLSGSTPGGIDLTKTLSYTGENLTGVTYS